MQGNHTKDGFRWEPVNVKVNLSLCFLQLSTTPWRRIGRGEVYHHIFLTSALDEGEWSTSRPDQFTPYGKSPCCQLDRRMGGPRAGLGAVVKRKIPSPRRDSNCRSSSPAQRNPWRAKNVLSYKFQKSLSCCIIYKSYYVSNVRTVLQF